MKFNYVFYAAKQIKIRHDEHYEYMLHNKLETYLIKLLHNYQFVRYWPNDETMTSVWFDNNVNIVEFTGLELLLRMQAELRNQF
jgi:hypothetical protein